MNKHVNSIACRLSLRTPQSENSPLFTTENHIVGSDQIYR
jgi:hypothetical protein